MHWEDLKADMNGVYDGYIKCGVTTMQEIDSKWYVMQRKEVPISNLNEYHLLQNSRRNKSAPSLTRSIFLLKDNEGHYVNNVCILQYIVENDEGRVEFAVQGHGNQQLFPFKKLQ